MEEECKRKQEDEVIVIKSVFEEEAKFEHRAWKIWKPLLVTIHLTPVESTSRVGKAAVSADLTVTCSTKYPNEPPQLAFSNVKGISSDAIGVLLRKLDEKCQSLLGDPMVLELCNEVREFLYENTTSVQGSFHDTMVKKKEEEMKEQRRQRLNSERREVEQIVEERERHNQEAKKEEAQKKTPFVEDAQIRMIAGRTIVVKSSNITKRQTPHKFCNEWVGVYQGEELLVSEWVFKYTLGRPSAVKKKAPVFDDFLKKCDEVESQLKRVPLLNFDHTVVPCLFCVVDRRSTTPQNINIHIVIGQKVSEAEQSLFSIINSVKHEPNVCRRLAGHALCALRSLHDENVAHGAVTMNTFWVSDNSFRLSDAGTLASLLSLSDSFQQAVSGKVCDPTVEEKKGRMRKDLFLLGVMIDEIRRAKCTSTSIAHTDQELTKFIGACQTAKTAEELLNLPYLKVDLVATGSEDSPAGSMQVDENGRLNSDFVLMKMLGKGGFGEVLLARNKLDDINYAIKRIPLYAKSEKLNKRIKREAKVFAKLNHPNVVRYYSAWIENTMKKEQEAGKKPSPNSKRPKSAAPSVDDSLMPPKMRNLELRGTSRGDGSWASNCKDDASSQSSSSEEESSMEEGFIFSPRDNNDDDEFEVVFENSSPGEGGDGTPTAESSGTPVQSTDKNGAVPQSEDSSDQSPASRILFIQMEFCGHATLRCLIDNKGLTGNPDLIWRMFREILSGLAYIHHQGMIHRDIKPMNILLDEEDRVKIGDFGLATRDFFRKMDAGGAAMSATTGQTKDIGTAFYMAPELFDESDTTPYSSKIDVFSTGIVLFEMFYKPMPPGMQRAETMTKIKRLEFPDDFGQDYSNTQKDCARHLINWMLHKNADCRPSVDELLADERISEDVDAQAVQAMMEKSLKNGSRNHTWMMQSLLNTEISSGLNYCFDTTPEDEKKKARPDKHIEYLREKITEVLHTHSFEPLYTHTLLPAPSVRQVAELRQKPVTLIDSAGFPVALPMDLRQSFVRYCCRNEVFRLKRYAFDRVYRNNDNIGFIHPHEKWECSLDCIAPASTALTVTSELLVVACELAMEALPSQRFTLRIGHMGLVHAALRHLTVQEDLIPLVLQKLHEVSTNPKVLSIADKQEMLAEVVGLKVATALFEFLKIESSFVVFKEECKGLVRSRDAVNSEGARSALNELERIVNIVNSVIDTHRLPITITFDASLVYRPTTFRDGITFLISTDLHFKRGTSRRLVIGGGRYDSSLIRERHPKDLQPPEPLILVGCSVSLEMLNNIRKATKAEMPPTNATVIGSCVEEYVMEKFKLARRLWAKGVSTDILQQPVEHVDELIEYCGTQGVSNLLVILGRDEVLVYSDSIDHGKMDFDTAVAQMSSESDDEHEVASFVATPINSSTRVPITPTHCATATLSNCNTNIATHERLSFAVKKRIENQVRNILSDAVTLFSARVKIEIVVTELSWDLLKNIAGAMSRTTTVEEMTVLFDGLARQFGKSKEALESLFACLKQIYSSRRDAVPVIIIFRHQDSLYKTIA